MRDKFKKLTSMVAAATLCAAAISFAGCADSYSIKALPGNIRGEVSSNGGFVVEKGDYVYFINGAEEYTASNKFGDVVKGALMRISKSDLAAKKYAEADTVVPMLFVAQNFDAGIYIYGDYVYYASPTTEKDQDGKVQNDWISFKRAKLDGTDAMKDYYFRSDDNAANYRFVEVENVVYCLHTDDKTLYSYNTETGTDTVLVSNAGSDFYFDSSDPENPLVYYTMGVTQDITSDASSTVGYTQLYSVRADATVETVDASKASYTVKGGKTYSFDANYIKNNSDRFADFDAKDYATYPYVNLGKLVLDGRGASDAYKLTQFSDDTSEPATLNGYTYSVQSYQNGGVYFTRTGVDKTSSDGENSKLYYLADETSGAGGWKSVAGNQSAEIDTVALNTTDASASAIFYIQDNVHYYIYISDSVVYRNRAKEDGVVSESVRMATGVSSATLWKIEGDYLYYYASGTNGNNLSRINYKGEAENYKPISPAYTEEYKPMKLLDIDWNSSWYKPEFIGTDLFYSNAQAMGSTSYNYVYVLSLKDADGKIMNAEELKAFNEKYEEVLDYIDEFDSDLKTAVTYYFRTGETSCFDEVLQDAKDKYNGKENRLYSAVDTEEFYAFAQKRKSNNTNGKDYSTMFGAEKAETYYGVESYFVNMLGQVKESDAEDMYDGWKATLKNVSKETEEGWKTWQKVLLGVGIGVGVLAVAAAVAIPLTIRAKKKAKAEADKEATAVKKLKIDTTDDKSIDVYADEEEGKEPAETEEENAAEGENAEENAEPADKKED